MIKIGTNPLKAQHGSDVDLIPLVEHDPYFDSYEVQWFKLDKKKPNEKKSITDRTRYDSFRMNQSFLAIHGYYHLCIHVVEDHVMLLLMHFKLNYTCQKHL